jgi:hypothetical protein
VFWRVALSQKQFSGLKLLRCLRAGFKVPQRELIRAIISNAVGYYPRKALDLEQYYRRGLLDSATGVLKMHAGDSGKSIHPILTAIEQYLDSRKATAGGEGQKTATLPSEAEAVKQAPKTQIDKAIFAIYEEYKAAGKKPPNVKQLISEFNRGKPITKAGLARLLKPFRILPTTIRLDVNHTAKGYYLSAFQDAFTRYLSAQTVTTSQTA